MQKNMPESYDFMSAVSREVRRKSQLAPHLRKAKLLCVLGGSALIVR